MSRLWLTWLLLFSNPALAADWTVQAGSTLGFSSSQQGEAFEGRFDKFSAQIRFDPAKLALCRFDVGIQLASANTHNSERDDHPNDERR